jgi:glucose 1-dehydrogenase
MSRQVVLVTGASSGIGQAIAIMAAKRGHDVAVHFSANLEGAEATASAVESAGGTALLLQADLANLDSISGMFSQLDATFVRLDALVNNAGMTAPSVPASEFDAARLQAMVTVNLAAPILIASEAAKRMSTRNGHSGGVIVNISSAAARLGAANAFVDYAATKAGLDIFTKGLSDEVADQGIRVCGIRPGLITTPLHTKGGVAGRDQKLAATVPMQRPGMPDEVAEAVLWLMSDQASYVTGTVLDVAGGR